MIYRRVATTLMAVLVCVVAAPLIGVAQGTTPQYAPDQAKDHVGEFATVEGRVVGVYQSRAGNVFLNFGAPYPRNTLTAVVFSSDVGKFKDLSHLKGATVRVTGEIKLYQGKPEMVLKEAARLRVVASSAD